MESAIERFRSLYKQDAALSVVLFLMLLVPLAFTFYTFENFEIPKYAASIVGVGVLLVVARRRTVFHRRSFLLWMLAGFIGWACLSMLGSPDFLNSLLGFYPRFANSLLFYICWALFF